VQQAASDFALAQIEQPPGRGVDVQQPRLAVDHGDGLDHRAEHAAEKQRIAFETGQLLPAQAAQLSQRLLGFDEVKSQAFEIRERLHRRRDVVDPGPPCRDVLGQLRDRVAPAFASPPRQGQHNRHRDQSHDDGDGRRGRSQ
jgi:hypothetical protein